MAAPDNRNPQHIMRAPFHFKGALSLRNPNPLPKTQDYTFLLFLYKG